jgi:hypothetical protein
MNIAFVLDTSPSMSQRTAEGISFLDCSKAAIEVMIQARMRSATDYASDKYMLITTARNPVLSGWEHERMHFMRTLKALGRTSLEGGVTLAGAVTAGFGLLNAYRHVLNTDTYGFGRLRAESGAVIVLTDKAGASLTRDQFRSESSSPFTTDIWRYDQRLFILQFHNSFNQTAVPDTSPLPELTGGQTFLVSSFAAALQTGETLMASHVNFHVFTVHLMDEEKRVMPACFLMDKKMRTSFWPLPEDYLQVAGQLPPRTPNPICVFSTKNSYTKFQPPSDFPYEIYEMMVQTTPKKVDVISKLRQPQGGTLFVWLSLKDHPKPFGCLCVDSDCVKMMVFCYNFLELWECLDFYKLQLAPKSEKSKYYEERLNMFFRELPQYYAHLIPNVLKSMKLYLPPTLKFPTPSPLPADFVSQLKLLNKQENQVRKDAEINSKQLAEQHAQGTATCCSQYSHSLYIDITTIPRDEISTALTSMSQQFFCSEIRTEVLISRMGDYHEVLSKRGVLRDPYHEREINLVLNADNFGNPFRKLTKETAQTIPMNEPDIRVPFQREETAGPDLQIQFVKLPVKRSRGFSASYERLKFVKRQCLSLQKAISSLRDPGPMVEDQLMSQLQTIVGKVYKKKNSSTINEYREGKMAFLEAIISQSRLYKKPDLALKIEALKKNLTS